MKNNNREKLKSIIRGIVSEMKLVPKKKSSTKTMILSIITEEIARAKRINEMSRQPMTVDAKGVVSGLGGKFVVPDAKSSTGYSTKGHGTFKDGTPTIPPKGPYVPKSAATISGNTAPAKKSGGGWMSKADKDETPDDIDDEEASEEGESGETQSGTISGGSSTSTPSDKKINPADRVKFIRDLVKNKNKPISKLAAKDDLGGVVSPRADDIEDELGKVSGYRDKARQQDLDADDERDISNTYTDEDPFA